MIKAQISYIILFLLLVLSENSEDIRVDHL